MLFCLTYHARYPYIRPQERISSVLSQFATLLASSRPEESHLQALAEPDLSLSTHPALTIQNMVTIK